MYKKLDSKGYDTDKGSNKYLEKYEEYFYPLIDKEIKLLELGVYKGGSLLLWHDYFEKGTIVGLDCHSVPLDQTKDRIYFYQGYQQDLALFDRIRAEAAPDGFDIIIDDASHIGELTRISFWHLFDNHLKPGGIYVIEDWRTGYWDKWIDGKRYKSPVRKNYIKDGIKNLLDSILKKLRKKSNDTKTSMVLIKVFQRFRNLTCKRKFPSHNFGMVGFVKELVDELGMDMITNPARGSTIPQRNCKFLKMEIYPGQIFIVKSPEEAMKRN